MVIVTSLHFYGNKFAVTSLPLVSYYFYIYTYLISHWSRALVLIG